MKTQELKAKEAIKLRQKQLAEGNVSLYLDIYWKGERVYDFLNLFINPGLTPTDRNLNRNTWKLAEQIKAQRIIDLQSGKYNIYEPKSELSFLEFFLKLTKQRFNSKGNYGNWDSMYKHLRAFSENKDITFGEIDEAWLNQLKLWLSTQTHLKGKKKLSQNSLYSYYNKVVAAVKIAFSEKLIHENPCERVKGVKPGETNREFLTAEELDKISQQPCDVPLLKTAFLFSCLTGLRWIDIAKMTWKEVCGSKTEGWYLRFQQQKTKGFEMLPITTEARQLLGKSSDPQEKVFDGLLYSAYTSVTLSRWMMRAGIVKKITFHCARHTNACLLLSQGVDIYVISKMLGHKHLKTTELYAKVTNMKKTEAISKLPKLRINAEMKTVIPDVNNSPAVVGNLILN